MNAALLRAAPLMVFKARCGEHPVLAGRRGHILQLKLDGVRKF